MSENMLEIRDLLIEAEIEGAWKPIVNSLSPVSYTHLTLPTRALV